MGKVILVCGKICSGKSYYSKQLKDSLNAVIISPDEATYELINNEQGEFYNVFSERLNKYLTRKVGEIAKAGDNVIFERGLWSSKDRKEIREYYKNKVKMSDKSIFLIEGLHALNEELTKDVDEKYKYKIYLSPFIPLSIDRYNYISTLDLRLLRRIVRDNRTRGYNVVDTIDNWQSVRNGEEKYIFPYIHQADVIINTALAYEVGVLKVYVEPLLLSVSVDSIYYEEARRLVDFLKQFFPIPGEYVNDESILREFIGGKYND